VSASGRQSRTTVLPKERGLGPALRRLRIQRGLRQSDFAGVPGKTIAHIEHGEIAKPHRGTLAAIGQKLGVSPDEIETF
jgi:transcriptional regulator with XRE-family HTH domain